jgi:hypothetical protein
VGYLLFGSPETKSGTRHELRVYGGGFWFDHSDAIHEVAGPSARIEWRIDNLIPDWGGSRLTFDAGYSHDEVRDDRWEVGARLRIPLGGTTTYASLSPQARRMQERIERDDDIITVKSGPEKVRDALTDVLFERVAYVNPSITEVSAKAGDNSLLIVNGTVSGPQQLQGNQTLQGGKSTIQVQGVKSGVTANFTAPGAKARLVDPGDAANLMLLGDNTHVAGLDIVGAGQASGLGNNDGIFGDSGLDNIFIREVAISETGRSGINFGSGNTASIADTEVSNTDGAAGINFGSSNIVSIVDTEISNAGSRGINFGSGNTVSIADTEISDTSFEGIGLFNDNIVSIADTEISNAGRDGISFGSGNAVSIVDTEISNAGRHGIQFVEGNTVNIADTEISDTGEDGIQFNAGNTVSLDNSSFTGTFGDDVIDIDAAGNTLSGDGNTAAGATFGGVFCEVTGVQIGQFLFPSGPSNCPPP